MKSYLSLFAETFGAFKGDFPGIEDFVREAAPKRLLDIGAGFGRTLEVYKGVPGVVLADRSSEMCEMARSRTKALGIPAEVVRCPSTKQEDDLLLR